MNQKPRKEELRELKSKTFLGGAWFPHPSRRSVQPRRSLFRKSATIYLRFPLDLETGQLVGKF